MKAIIFGASGMIGQGVLKECLKDSNVDFVLSVGRSSTGLLHPKLKELKIENLENYQGLEDQLIGFDACFFCLGTSSMGKSESEYRHVTYDFTMAAAHKLVELNKEMTFVYVSAIGADPSENGSVMWARVRGQLENSLLKMPFKSVYIFRPAIVQPLDGIHSKTKSYDILYKLMKPVMPALLNFFPSYVSSTQIIGRAMLEVVVNGYERQILETADFKKAASRNQI